MGLYNLYNFKKGHHKQITKSRTREVAALKGSVAKHFATGGTDQFLKMKFTSKHTSLFHLCANIKDLSLVL